MDPDIEQMLGAYGLPVYSRQLMLRDSIDDRKWTMDQDAGLLRMADGVSFPAQILGSTSVNSGTWRWAWANDSVSESLTAASRIAAEIGVERGISFLVEPELDYESYVDGHLVALAVTGLLDADAYYRGKHRGGEVYVLIDAPIARQRPTRPESHAVYLISLAIRHAPQLVTRAGIAAYLEGLGIPMSETHDEIRIGTGNPSRFRFDEQGRLIAMEGTTSRDPSTFV